MSNILIPPRDIIVTYSISYIFIYVKGNSSKFFVNNIKGDSMKNKKKITKSDYVVSQPETTFELLNKYGTYEIQPTCDSDNDFPKIAQGLPKEENRKIVDKD